MDQISIQRVVITCVSTIVSGDNSISFIIIINCCSSVGQLK